MIPAMGVHRFLTAIGGTVALTLLLAPLAQAAAPALKWDEGEAEVDAPPFEFGFTLGSFDKPAEIRRGQTVRLGVGVYFEDNVCAATLLATPTLDGNPLSTAVVLIDGESDDDLYDDDVTVRFPVRSKGTYALSIQGVFTRGNPTCFRSPGPSQPYEATIELFTLTKDPPEPASTKKVAITSSGPRTLVANTRGRSPAIRVTFDIKDPEKRKELLHSICMRDTSDCWFEDAPLKPKSYMRKTANGWVRTWDFYWERTSPSTCFSYAWNQPDVSVIMVVSNADGKVIGRKKHTVKLTCRR